MNASAPCVLSETLPHGPANVGSWVSVLRCLCISCCRGNSWGSMHPQAPHRAPMCVSSQRKLSLCLWSEWMNGRVSEWGGHEEDEGDHTLFTLLTAPAKHWPAKTNSILNRSILASCYNLCWALGRGPWVLSTPTHIWLWCQHMAEQLLEIGEEKHSPYLVECFTEWMTSHSHLILLTHLGKRIGW